MFRKASTLNQPCWLNFLEHLKEHLIVRLLELTDVEVKDVRK